MHVDPKQLQAELQKGFDHANKLALDAQAIAMAQIKLHKMTLQALTDLGLIDPAALSSALTSLAKEEQPELAREIFESMAKAHGPDSSESQPPALRLVHSQPGEPD